MKDNIFGNNKVSLTGEIVSDFVYSHKAYEEDFYMVEISVNRLSDYVDYVPVMVSGRLIDFERDYRRKFAHITGEFRSFSRREEGKNRLVLFAFARELEVMEESNKETASNQIFLDGYICKETIYRITPLGREVTDLFLAVNHSYDTSYYIPCICWGRDARIASNFKVGTRVQLWGRIQSREYIKKISETETEPRIAYEVSVSRMEV